ncbi:MAG: hypothetical protein RBS24_02445 [Bacilli bacterium]|nr:hypothetical protein [Bacilli bacterium]
MIIKSIKDLEAIKTKMAPAMYLKNAKPSYKIIFSYNQTLKDKGADELIDYTIKTLLEQNRLDIVVLKEYKEEVDDLCINIISKDMVTNYQHLNKATIDLIIAKHLIKEDK